MQVVNTVNNTNTESEMCSLFGVCTVQGCAEHVSLTPVDLTSPGVLELRRQGESDSNSSSWAFNFYLRKGPTGERFETHSFLFSVSCTMNVPW